MRHLFRTLRGCTKREIAADALAQVQAEEHAVAMDAAKQQVEAAEAAAAVAERNERAAQKLLRRLAEDARND